MYCLSIGISAPVFEILNKRAFEMSPKEYTVLNAVKQQEIIISDNIIEYYKANVSCSEVVDSIITAYGNGNLKFKFLKTKEQFESPLEELLYYVSKQEMRIVVAEKADLKGCCLENVNLVSTTKLAKDKYTPLSRFVFPVNYHVKPNCSCESIATWFRVLFKGEKKIEIQDKYILNSHGMYSLKNYYLPNMEKDVELNIYCTSSPDLTEDDIENAAHDLIFDAYNVNIYFCKRMKHDRYIELSKLRIKVGAGLDLLGEDNQIWEGKECDIDVIRISESERLSIPRISKKVR